MTSLSDFYMQKHLITYILGVYSVLEEQLQGWNLKMDLNSGMLLSIT